ncbi:MAG: hypothetical protein ACHBN1_33815 [Heteroscytonema crispum UTEX LB 1556]
MHGARLIYLSPYSPDFNPIENCCSVKNSCVLSLRDRASVLEQAIALSNGYGCIK